MPTLEKMRATLIAAGWHVGARDPRLNTKFPGRFMVAEPYDESQLPTEDASRGPWCLVGDDEEELIHEAFEEWVMRAFD